MSRRNLWITVIAAASMMLGYPQNVFPFQEPPVRVSWEVQRQLAIGGNQPNHPALASQAQVYGSVHVEFTVRTDGTTKDFRVLKGHPLLIQAVIDAIRTWRFKPVGVNAVPRETQTVTVVNFLGPRTTVSSHLKKFIEAVDRKPNDPKAHEALARELFEVGEFKQSADAFRKALSFSPSAARLHISLGDALGMDGDVPTAIDAYRQGLSLNPKDSDARFSLARWLDGSGNLDAAIAEYEQVVRSAPRLAGAHYGLGRALEKKGDLDRALKEYEAAAKLRPVPEYHEARDRLRQQTRSR